MDALRAERERQGLTLQQLSERTRIPVDHLEALEAGRVSDLPEGPYAELYGRAVREALAMDGADPAAAAVPTASDRPLWQVRVVAALMVAAVVVLVSWRIYETWVPATGATAGPDQRVSILARRNTGIVVVVDGQTVVDKTVAGGETVEVAGYDRVEVDLSALGDARVDYNGERIVPQGRQDAPRRLVFIDDGGR